MERGRVLADEEIRQAEAGTTAAVESERRESAHASLAADLAAAAQPSDAAADPAPAGPEFKAGSSDDDPEVHAGGAIDDDPLGEELIAEMRRGLTGHVEAAENESATEPVAFDFKRPGGLGRHFEQNLRNLAENLAKMSSISLTSLLRANTTLELREVGLSPYADYLATVPRPSCLAIVALPPLQGRALLHLDLGICFSLLKRLMGGAAEAEKRTREFTEIERGVVCIVIQKFLELLRQAGARLLDLAPEFVSLENNPDYITGISAGDTLVRLSFAINLESENGVLDLCLPLTGFEPVRDLFDPQEHAELRSEEEVDRDRRRVLHVIQGTDCDIIVKFAELKANLEWILRLQEGDVIPLKQMSDAPFRVEIAGKDAFWGEAGRLNQQRAVRLTQRISEE
jgi:flagellar motor switch protein FliM